MRFAENRHTNTDTLDALHGVDRSLGTDFWDFLNRHYWEKNFGRDSLLKYLNDLDTETLKRLVAVIYSGRGTIDFSEGRPDAYREYFQDAERNELIGTITGFHLQALGLYLEKGLLLAEKHKIDLDGLVL